MQLDQIHWTLPSLLQHFELKLDHSFLLFLQCQPWIFRNPHLKDCFLDHCQIFCLLHHWNCQQFYIFKNNMWIGITRNPLEMSFSWSPENPSLLSVYDISAEVLVLLLQELDQRTKGQSYISRVPGLLTIHRQVFVICCSKKFMQFNQFHSY